MRPESAALPSGLIPHQPLTALAPMQDVTDLAFMRVIAHYGFMETPDVPQLLARDDTSTPTIEYTTFFLGRETLLSAKKPSMAAWRSKLFALMSRNAHAATAYFHIPTDRVIEVGMQIEL